MLKCFMKFLISTTFLILLSFSALSETYSCSYDYYGENKPVAFERYGDGFRVVGDRDNFLPIFFEDNELLVLANLIQNEFGYEGVATTIINKFQKNFRMIVLYEFAFKDKTSAIGEGKCVVYY